MKLCVIPSEVKRSRGILTNLQKIPRLRASHFARNDKISIFYSTSETIVARALPLAVEKCKTPRGF
jgi:hypothetical protein